MCMSVPQRTHGTHIRPLHPLGVGEAKYEGNEVLSNSSIVGLYYICKIQHEQCKTLQWQNG